MGYWYEAVHTMTRMGGVRVIEPVLTRARRPCPLLLRYKVQLQRDIGIMCQFCFGALLDNRCKFHVQHFAGET